MPNSALKTSRAPRWRRRADARPEEILRAATEVFVEKGYAAANVSDIADRAGVTKGTIYNYFPNKEALFKAVIQVAVVPNLVDAEEAVERCQGSAAALLRGLALGWWERVRQEPLGGLVKLVTAEAANFPELARYYMDTVVLRARRIYAGVLQRGIASGEFRPHDLDFTVREIMSPVLFAATWMTSLGRYEPAEFDYDAYINAHLDMVLSGIAARPKE